MSEEKIIAEGEEASGGSASFICKGTVASAIVNGEAEISIFKDSVTLTALFDSVRLSWADVVKLDFVDYVAYIKTKTSDYVITKLGLNGEPFYNHLLAAYGNKVRESLFVKGSPVVKGKGDVLVNEITPLSLRGVPVEVYDNCVVSLPNDLSARRMPLSFVNGFSDKDFTISILAMDGKRAEYSKLGYEHAPISKAIQDAIRALKAEMIKQIEELDPLTNDEQASRLSRFMPGGLAAPMGLIKETSPSFAAALEAKIAESRAAETYKVFKEISGPDAVCVGFKQGSYASGTDAGTEEAGSGVPAGGIGEMLSSLPGAAISQENSADEEAQKPDYMLWIAAPSPSGNSCAIEFAGAENESAATFVYRFEGSWDLFRIKLGMALEAIDWKREVIRLTNEELMKPENEIYRMAEDRNEALRFIRSSFVGRAIHRSMESWKSQVNELLG